MGEDTLMEDESHHPFADVGGPVGSDLSGSPNGLEPGPKLVSVFRGPVLILVSD